MSFKSVPLQHWKAKRLVVVNRRGIPFPLGHSLKNTQEGKDLGSIYGAQNSGKPSSCLKGSDNSLTVASMATPRATRIMK